MEKTIEQKVISALSEISGIREDDINRDLHLTGDLELDSLNRVEVVMAIEEMFNDDIKIKDEDVNIFEKVGEVIDYVENKVKVMEGVTQTK